MKRYILNGIVLIGALALGSCSSTSKLASAKVDDDVYFSQAKAGDEPVYVERSYRADNQAAYSDADDDYYYYDSYASRINRFSYASPYSYYNDIYYGYSPYAYSPYYGGWGLNIGIGLGGYGYSPYGYSPYGYGGFGYGYGYSPYGYGYYSPYNYYGIGYGGYGYGGGYYGNGGYWGIYSANRSVNTPRPYRGSGSPTGGYTPRTRVGYNGSGVAPGVSYGGRPARGTVNNGGNTSVTRPSERPTRPNYEPSSRPTSVERPSYSPSPSSSSGGGRSSSGGGGSRPSRP